MNNPRLFDSAAFGSDIARSRAQLWARRLANIVVRLLGLNRGGFLATEIVQAITPVLEIPIASGTLRSRGGHGRLRWRMETFFAEEPETIRWLDSFSPDDVFWDIGANVGLYGIYAALQARCRVYSFEPEAQNFALLIENILLNDVQDLVVPLNVPLTRKSGLGTLRVHALTKGGAYNQFLASGVAGASALIHMPSPIVQMQMGITADDLVAIHKLPFPTHIKIDVDGNEPDIVAGAAEVLRDPRLKSILIELAPGVAEHDHIHDVVRQAGFNIVSSRSNWDSRSNREGESARPQQNVIFRRK